MTHEELMDEIQRQSLERAGGNEMVAEQLCAAMLAGAILGLNYAAGIGAKAARDIGEQRKADAEQQRLDMNALDKLGPSVPLTHLDKEKADREFGQPHHGHHQELSWWCQVCGHKVPRRFDEKASVSQPACPKCFNPMLASNEDAG